MEQSKISEVMGITMGKIKEMVDVNTIIGDPVTTPDGITIIPVSKVSFGFASGGSDLKSNEITLSSGFAGGSGAGIKIDPVGFLVVKEGNVRMLSMTSPANSTVDRLVGLVPDVIEKVDDFIKKHKKED